MSEPLTPAYVKWILQNGRNTDCAVACLAMLCGCNYEEALAASVVVQPTVLECGLTWGEIRRVAEEMDCEVKLLRRGFYDIDEASGILNVKNKASDHVALLWEGRIVEGDGSLWLDPEAYCKHHAWKPYSLLVRVG